MKQLFCRSIVAATVLVSGATSVAAAPRGYAPRDVFKSEIVDRSLDAWRMQGDWNRASQQASHYYEALRFAECVRSFDAAAADRALAFPMADSRQNSGLVRLAQQYRGCASQKTAVAPLLLRAAFGELLLKQSGSVTGGSHSSVGVPKRVGNFPVAAIAECQVSAAPGMVADLLRTRPGDMAEEEIVTRLFDQTPQCDSQAAGSITPTAARLAIVEAALARN